MLTETLAEMTFLVVLLLKQESDSNDNVSNGAAPALVLTCVTAADMNGQGACGAE